MTHMNTLFRMLFGSISSNHAGLPYNLNWQHKPSKSIQKFLKNTSLRIMDIGARSGYPTELQALRQHIEYIAFDADPEEAHALTQIKTNGLKSKRIFPYFVTKTKENITFNLYKNRGESSGLLPDTYYQHAFAPNTFVIEKQILIEGNSLAWIAQKEGLPSPDFLKLDTQGTELYILQGAGNWIGQIPLIETEIEFLPLYQNQPLFHDVGQFMHTHGYVLLYLNRVFTSRQNYRGKSRGQIIFGDALYGLGLPQVSTLDTLQKTKYVILLIQYGHRDFACEIVSTYPEIRDILPSIEQYFKPEIPFISLFTRLFWMQIDKFITLLLWLRKTNQLRSDSDRSWPVR